MLRAVPQGGQSGRHFSLQLARQEEIEGWCRMGVTFGVRLWCFSGIIYLFILKGVFLFLFFLMWSILKVFTEFVTAVLLFYILAARKVDLRSPTKDQTLIPCTGRQSHNHWTTKDVPLWNQLYGKKHPGSLPSLSIMAFGQGTCLLQCRKYSLEYDLPPSWWLMHVGVGRETEGENLAKLNCPIRVSLPGVWNWLTVTESVLW